MDTNDNIKDFNRLCELGGSDYEMASGEPNIKGWLVKDALGKDVGAVKELLFNPGSRLVRYIILTPHDLDNRSEVLIPIGFAQLHEKEDLVELESVTREQIALLPSYQDVNVSPAEESEIRRILNGMSENVANDVFDEHFYNHPSFNLDRLYSQRRKMG